MYESVCAENRGLLWQQARRYARACELDRAASLEDLVQAGSVGLMRAADSFDAAAGMSWASWAVWHIKREIQTLVGIRTGQPPRAHFGALSLDAPLAAEDPDGDSLGDMLPDTSLPESDSGLLLDELRRAVREGVGRLQDSGERRVTELHHLEGRTRAETAEALSVSPDEVRRMDARALRKLRNDYRLQSLADDLDSRTRFHAHKGVAAFKHDWTSVTEGAALWRIQQREKAEARKGPGYPDNSETFTRARTSPAEM